MDAQGPEGLEARKLWWNQLRLVLLRGELQLERKSYLAQWLKQKW